MPDDLCLNIGAGATYLPGFKNIDIDSRAEIQIDLSEQPLPFDDDSASLVFSYHTLEHVPNYLFALGEIHRVLKHDGTLLLGLPYVTLTEYHQVNPYHLHNFSEHSFAFFDTDKLKGSAVEDNPILFKQVMCRYDYLSRTWRYMPEPIRAWGRRHLLNVVKWFELGLVAVKDPSQPVTLGKTRELEMGAVFDRLMTARVPYTQPAVSAG